jgi:hypothetical protein
MVTSSSPRSTPTSMFYVSTSRYLLLILRDAAVHQVACNVLHPLVTSVGASVQPSAQGGVVGTGRPGGARVGKLFECIQYVVLSALRLILTKSNQDKQREFNENFKNYYSEYNDRSRSCPSGLESG